ncbi:PREDICTED: uncharacterized protein LOC108559667 isoform X2 [Nicrophorus vespilloides]|uniref:Uncharacterized protein LOC108559667 isoform X2 n=1 Tax=Nicrophorus vespilloides TaxID=110193 RepID=A0ABM1MD57_NICVS|nr:PREDICTED: uncharacterized protein LOC108559667 isoform X2 [Nicrophorus vespilloides]
MHGYPVMQVVQYHVPHPIQPAVSYNLNASVGGSRIRKYVFWCCACGGLSTILGGLFLAVYFLLRSYTSTLGYFETIPTFVPAAMLILTGLCVISLARRKNRYSYLLKVCGLCCLVCALTCVLVTITTTVIHMNRLQTLRECVYTQKTRTCTCYSVLLEAHSQTDEGMRFVFDSTPDCEVIHGALYTCLRAMFGLSVSGILVCIFSCMLVYQLLSHERKKMYWEQLELRCRSFYQQQSGPPVSAPSSMRGPPLPPATYCSCCEECRYPAPQIYPWDAHHAAAERFWTPGRVGNFYSPNPGEEMPPTENNRIATGWNWRRLPWTRTAQPENQRDSLSYQGISSADSQYGFSNRGGEPNVPVSSTGSYSVLDNRPVGGVYVWGPPPPYSNPNSPARRQLPNRYHHHHMHPHDNHCQMNEENQRGDFQRRSRHKDNYENTVEAEVQQVENSENTDTSSCERVVTHTLPVRKMKKMQTVKMDEEHKYHEPNLPDHKNEECRFLPRLQGVENAAFQKQENSPQKLEPTESEVYFADVSSCCNISVRNDGQDSSLYDEAVDSQKPRLLKPEAQENDDYLTQKLGNRQMSIRSRLPFPLPEEPKMPKDISQNSLSSSVQTPITESTDDCITPTADCFIPNEFLAPDAQYEVIQENATPSPSYRNNLTTTISNLNYNYNSFNTQAPMPQTPTRRNISTIIQNMATNPTGMMYAPESKGEDEKAQNSQHSDATVDSGWHSGSEKTDKIDALSKPVNV